MSAALRLYEQLTEAKDDQARARLIAEAFDELESRFPQLTDLATQGHVRESELRLQKEIKEVEARLQKEIKEVEARLQTEIRKIDARIAETEARLQKDIREVDAKISALEVRLTQTIHRQTVWVIGAVGTVIGLIRLLEILLA